MLLHIPSIRTVALAIPKRDPQVVALLGVHIHKADDNYYVEAAEPVEETANV